jgi:hypothetical protein
MDGGWGVVGRNIADFQSVSGKRNGEIFPSADPCSRDSPVIDALRDYEKMTVPKTLCNPFGVEMMMGAFLPRVAAARQPGATFCNPFGIFSSQPHPPKNLGILFGQLNPPKNGTVSQARADYRLRGQGS